MSDGGKGSSPRPFSVNYHDYSDNYDRIFGKKKKAEDNININGGEVLHDTDQQSEVQQQPL